MNKRGNSSQWWRKIIYEGAVGWTKAEYDASPDMAARLHGRILDLEAERYRYRTALEEIAREAELAPMEDGLDAGGIAWRALRDV